MAHPSATMPHALRSMQVSPAAHAAQSNTSVDWPQKGSPPSTVGQQKQFAAPLLLHKPLLLKQWFFPAQKGAVRSRRLFRRRRFFLASAPARPNSEGGADRVSGETEVCRQVARPPLAATRRQAWCGMGDRD